MKRATLIATAMLALLTGFVLGELEPLAVGFQAPQPAESEPSPRELTAAHAFYEGIDRLFASGDRSIETTAAPGFTEHTADTPAERTLPEMVDGLLTQRATWPHLRMTVVDLQAQDQLIAARLEIDPGDPVPIPGVPLTPPIVGQVLEFLRVEGTAVTDRWDAGATIPMALARIQADVEGTNSSLALPVIEQLSLAPGHSMQLPLLAPLILLCETGSVQLDRGGTDLNGIKRPTQEPLDAGVARILRGAKRAVLTVRNTTSVPAEVWAFSPDGQPLETPVSVSATPTPAGLRIVAFLPTRLSSYLSGNNVGIAITRLSLPPGTVVPIHELGAVEEIAVLDGALEVTTSEGRALKCTDGSTARPFDGTETISAGEGVSARESVSLGYRAVGSNSTTLLIMRFEQTLPDNSSTPLASPVAP